MLCCWWSTPRISIIFSGLMELILSWFSASGYVHFWVPDYNTELIHFLCKYFCTYFNSLKLSMYYKYVQERPLYYNGLLYPLQIFLLCSLFCLQLLKLINFELAWNVSPFLIWLKWPSCRQYTVESCFLTILIILGF